MVSFGTVGTFNFFIMADRNISNNNPQYWMQYVLDLINQMQKGQTNPTQNGQGQQGNSNRPGSEYYPGTSPDNDPTKPGRDPTDGSIIAGGSDYNSLIQQITNILSNRDSDAFQALGGKFDDTALQAILGYLSYNEDDDDFKHGAQQDLLKWMQTLNQRQYEQAQTAEQRAYNEQVLNEQRMYDSPTALLQRLMATGMSREAALQMISQSGLGGSGSGSALIGDAAMAQPSYAAEYNQPGGTTLRNYIGAGTDIVNTLVNLFSMGINGFQAVASGTASIQQALALKQQDAAIKAGSAFNSMYQSAVDSGLIDKKAIHSFDDARSALLNLSQASSPAIYDYMHNGGYEQMKSTPMALDYAGQYFNNNYSHGDAVARSRQMMALADAYELKPKEILTAIDKQDAEIQKIFHDIQLSDDTYDLEVRKVDAEVGYMDAQSELTRETTKQRELENSRIKIALHREEITADDLDQVALYQASYELQIAQKTNDPQVMKDTLESIALNEKQRRAIMAFNCLRLQNVQTMLNQPNGQALLNWSTFYDNLGLGSMFNSWMQAMPPDLMKSKKNQLNNFVASFGIQPRNWFTRNLKESGSANVNLFGN